MALFAIVDKAGFEAGLDPRDDPFVDVCVVREVSGSTPGSDAPWARVQNLQRAAGSARPPEGVKGGASIHAMAGGCVSGGGPHLGDWAGAGRASANCFADITLIRAPNHSTPRLHSGVARTFRTAVGRMDRMMPGGSGRQDQNPLAAAQRRKYTFNERVSGQT